MTQSRPEEETRRREQADGLDRLGRESQAVDRFGIRVENRQADRRRQRVAGEQTAEDDHRRQESTLAFRVQRDRDSERREQIVAAAKPTPGPTPSRKWTGARAPWIPALAAQATMTKPRNIRSSMSKSWCREGASSYERARTRTSG